MSGVRVRISRFGLTKVVLDQLTKLRKPINFASFARVATSERNVNRQRRCGKRRIRQQKKSFLSDFPPADATNPRINQQSSNLVESSQDASCQHRRRLATRRFCLDAVPQWRHRNSHSFRPPGNPSPSQPRIKLILTTMSLFLLSPRKFDPVMACTAHHSPPD